MGLSEACVKVDSAAKSSEKEIRIMIVLCASKHRKSVARTAMTLVCQNDIEDRPRARFDDSTSDLPGQVALQETVFASPPRLAQIIATTLLGEGERGVVVLVGSKSSRDSSRLQ